MERRENHKNKAVYLYVGEVVLIMFTLLLMTEFLFIYHLVSKLHITNSSWNLKHLIASELNEGVKMNSFHWSSVKVIFCLHKRCQCVSSVYPVCIQCVFSTVCRSSGSELMMEFMKASSLSKTPSFTCSCCRRALIWETVRNTLPVLNSQVIRVSHVFWILKMD